MNNFKTVLLTSLAILSLGLVATSYVNSEVDIAVVAVSDNVTNYYSSITDDMSGTTLLNALNKLNNEKRTRTVTYAGMRTFSVKSDADPDGSGKVLGFYDNKLVGPSWDSGATWNREHVWPNIRGGNKVEDDAHMVRPTATSTNSDRGSKGYGTASYDPGKYVPYYRGSAARIIFYAAIADLSLGLVDDPLNYNGAGNYPNMMGSLSDMLKWNLEYQPSDTSFTGDNDLARRSEINRNEVIQNDMEGQGNRNPFIDHPEYACRIWGNTNKKTKQICSGNYSPETPDNPDTPDNPTQVIKVTALTINPSHVDLTIGQTNKDLSIETTPNNANTFNFVWGSDNESVATISKDGIITAVGKGNAIISVVDIETGIMGECTVNVMGPNSCGGSIVTTSLILSTISLLGAGLLLIRTKEN